LPRCLAQARPAHGRIGGSDRAAAVGAAAGASHAPTGRLYKNPVQVAARARFAGPIDLTVDEPLAGDVLTVTREALSNCARHAHASIVEVAVIVAHDSSPCRSPTRSRHRHTHRSSGLTNVRRRAERHAGHLDITEPATGGTRLTWSAVITSRQPATDGPVPDGTAPR
jgi:hypothetical protein